jgi:aminoglycoside 2'-N-acetyltransferase I
MDRDIAFDSLASLSDADRADIRALSQAVYPSAEAANWPGRFIEWANPVWCARVWAPDGTLASFVGVLLRQAAYNEQPVTVGGVGGVMTHPLARRRGYAKMGMHRASEFFTQQPDVGFALLVCQPHLIHYYGSMGWREFSGKLWVRQHGAIAEFTFNRVMTLGVSQEAPIDGAIDLCGPPW